MKLITIAAFVKRRYRPARQMNRLGLLSWLTFFLREGVLGVIQNSSGKIIAVGGARRLADLSYQPLCYCHHPDGKYLFVDFVVGDRDRTVGNLLHQTALKKFPEAEFIAFRRGQKTGAKFKIYPLNRFQKLIK